MNIFQIHAAILKGIAEQIETNFPHLNLKIEIGVTRITAKNPDGSRAFILVLDNDGIVLQDSQSRIRTGVTTLEEFKDFEYADPRLFDQINEAITEICGEREPA